MLETPSGTTFEEKPSAISLLIAGVFHAFGLEGTVFPKVRLELFRQRLLPLSTSALVMFFYDQAIRTYHVVGFGLPWCHHIHTGCLRCQDFNAKRGFAQEDLNVVRLVDADSRCLVGDLHLHIGAVHHVHRRYDRVDH